jgi:hypothetical protein
MTAEGDRQDKDRRGWHVEIMNRANQPVLTVAFAEVLGPEAAGLLRQSYRRSTAPGRQGSQP